MTADLKDESDEENGCRFAGGFQPSGLSWVAFSAWWFSIAALIAAILAERGVNQFETVFARSVVHCALNLVVLRRNNIAPFGDPAVRKWLILRGEWRECLVDCARRH
jgi:hypothetical protein